VRLRLGVVDRADSAFQVGIDGVMEWEVVRLGKKHAPGERHRQAVG